MGKSENPASNGPGPPRPRPRRAVARGLKA